VTAAPILAFGGPLTEHDYESLAARAITRELADENGIRRIDCETGRAMFARKRGNLSGLIIPNVPPWNPGNPREYRLRLDEPELEHRSDGTTRERNKYISPPGRPNLLYFPFGVPAASLVDASIPVLITEGEFKAIASTALAFGEAKHAMRFLPVGITGAWNFRGVTGKANNSRGSRVDTTGLLSDFNHLWLRGRRVILAYDTDVQSNPKVRAARSKLASSLIELGATVGNLEWPIEQGKGLDDLLTRVGPESVLRMIEAVEFGDWRSRLLRNDAGKLIACHENAALFLENSAEWDGVLGYDEFRDGHMVLKWPPPPITAAPGDELTDAFDIEATRWFERRHMRITPAMTRAVIDCFARRNGYHPVRDYLWSLPVWDNTPRVSTWLCTYCGVTYSGRSDQDEFERKESEKFYRYVNAVGKMFLVSAVARVMRPGCKVDHTLVLEGEQGTLKSTAVRILAGDDFFTDQINDFSNKDASMQVRGIWIIGELAAITGARTEMEKVKRFLTQQDDRFRVPYGRRVVRVPRQCTFIATTNADDWMKDETGNRRFWPVKCGKIDIDALKRDRDQL
jgi:hypothetical protein